MNAHSAGNRPIICRSLACYRPSFERRATWEGDLPRHNRAMPFCPSCRLEYREEFERCADCGASLVTELPALSSVQPHEPAREVRLATYSTWSEASMWAEWL